MKWLTSMIKYHYERSYGTACTLIHHDGEVKKSRLRQLSDGTLVVKVYCEWVVAHRDGSVEKSYVKKWVNGIVTGKQPIHNKL